MFLIKDQAIEVDTIEEGLAPSADWKWFLKVLFSLKSSVTNISISFVTK